MCPPTKVATSVLQVAAGEFAHTCAMSERSRARLTLVEAEGVVVEATGHRNQLVLGGTVDLRERGAEPSGKGEIRVSITRGH
eukprot:3130826-Prymnesium_polylepis.1